MCSSDLSRVQQRRMLPTRVIQRMQIAIQNMFLEKALKEQGRVTVPLPMKLLQRFPFLRRLPARLIGVGIRPEHVRLQTSNFRLQ